MSRYFPKELLRRLRNDISWAPLLKQLDWPHKIRDGQLAFLCPSCNEYDSAVNPRTNLGRCFACKTNFNPIDLTMAVQDWDFVTVVDYLEPFLLPCATPPDLALTYGSLSSRHGRLFCRPWISSYFAQLISPTLPPFTHLLDAHRGTIPDNHFETQQW